MDPTPRRRRLEAGFTLIEIMVVILILGLLATIVVQSLKGRDRQGQAHQGRGRHLRNQDRA